MVWDDSKPIPAEGPSVTRRPATSCESRSWRVSGDPEKLGRLSTPEAIWNLILLRYRLLRGQARTGTGRRALFAAGYVLGGSLLLLLFLAGSAAVAPLGLPEREVAARWIFTGIWVNGATVNLLLGRGTRQSTLDAVLRPYPLTRTERLWLRHLSGLLDPVWLFLTAATATVATGGVAAGWGTTALHAMVVLLFVGICYLSSLLLLTAVDFILSHRGGGTIIGAAAFILFLVAGLLAACTAEESNAFWVYEADLALRFLPPGAAASLLARAQSSPGLLDAGTLLLWSVCLASVLARAERRALAETSVTSVSGVFGILCDWIAGLSGGSLGPLIGKALRYQMRCDRVRFSYAATVPLVLLLPRFMSRGSGAYMAFLETAALMFLSPILATASMTLNQFGYDDDGVRRYWILPITAASALHAASIASLLSGGALVLVLLAGLPFLACFPLDGRAVAILASSAVAGLFLFNAIGLWTSVLSPRKGSFRGVVGNELSFNATLAVGSGIAISLAAAFAVEELIPRASLLACWWGFVPVPVICAALYLVSCGSVSKALAQRRELVTHAVSGADRA